MKIKKYLLGVCLFVLNSCTSFYQPKQITYYDYRVSQYRKKDSTMLTLLQPYADSVNKTMYKVIAQLAEPLEKKQPNGSMGLFFVDAQRIMAAVKYGKKVDAGFINNGGLRITNIPAGPVTVGKVYEVMPFDNMLIVQTLKGDVLQQLLDLIARKGGWPVSGLTFSIVNGKATNIIVGGAAFNKDKQYTIAISDYLANGGDDCDMLRKLPQENNNILLRDVFIEYLTKEGAKGNSITPPEEERIKKM